MESAATTTRTVDGSHGDAARPATARAERRASDRCAHVRDYIALTKPRIISLLLLTTVATMFVADPSGPPLVDHPLDDARRLPGRRRRRGDQPLPRPRPRRPDGPHPRRGRWSPAGSSRSTASSSGSSLGVLAVVQLAITVNVPRRRAGARRAAGLRLRLHDVAEAADAAEHRHRRRGRRRAAAGRLGGRDGRSRSTRSIPFAIVFLWTPPHFWALALLIKDDYARTGVPMLPGGQGRAGDAAPDPRLRVILVAFTVLPFVTGLFGGPLPRSPRSRSAGPSSGSAARLAREPSRRAALRLYLSSLAYLALLFCAMALDRAL